MYKIFTTIALWLLLSATAISQATFINEIDYQGPVGCLEIVTPTGTDLSGYDLIIYDDQGNLQETRDIVPVITAPLGSYDIIIVDAVIFANPNDPGAIGLVDNNGNVLQFLSFDGPIVATDGPAVGLTSDPIGVQTNPNGSLQLEGTGGNPDELIWSDEEVATCGEENINQALNVAAQTVLPVTLAYFKATCEKGIVDLNWKTLSEINADYFVVEKSTNGRNWEVLNHVDAAQNTIEVRTYNTKDFKPATGTNYYRLSQTDLDGTLDIFNIVSVTNHGTGSIKIFPNPAVSVLNIQLPAGDNYEDTKVFIRDMVGREIEFKYETALDLSNLDPGTYYLRVISGQNEYHQLFIRKEN